MSNEEMPLAVIGQGTSQTTIEANPKKKADTNRKEREERYRLLQKLIAKCAAVEGAASMVRIWGNIGDDSVGMASALTDMGKKVDELYELMHKVAPIIDAKADQEGGDDGSE